MRVRRTILVGTAFLLLGAALGLALSIWFIQARESTEEIQRTPGLEAAREEVRRSADPSLGPDSQLKEVIANVCDGVYRTEQYEVAAEELYDRLKEEGALTWPDDYTEAVNTICDRVWI